MASVNEDRNLASQIAQGDQQSVEVLDGKHRHELETLARFAGLPLEDCKDAAQETLIGAVYLIQRGQFRGESSLRTLLFSILRKKIADYRRRQVVCGRGLDTDSKLFTGIEDVAGPLLKSDTKLMTEKALRSLPDEYRLILLLNQVWGYTIEEIGLRIGRSRGRTGAMLAEAKKMFRNNLG